MMKAKSWRGWRTAGMFLVLAVAMGALQWNWFAMPLERDEGEYAYAAWLMRTGKGVPYRDSFLQKPPMIVYTYGLVEALAPGSDKVGFRVAGFLAALATAGLVWRLGKRDFGGHAGGCGAWLWVVFLQQLTMFCSVAANVEKFMVAPMLGAMALAGNGERRGWRWAAAGTLAGMAVLFKPICVPVLGVYFLLACWGRTKKEWGRTAACWGWLALGGTLAVGAGVAWFAWKGALGDLWECTVEYTGAYAGMVGSPWLRGAAWLAVAGHWKAWLVLGLAAAGFCGRERAGWRWGAVFAVAWAVAMSDPNGHYYVMALPLAAIGAGAAIERTVAWCGGAGRWVGAAGIAAVSAAMMTGTESVAWRCTPRQLAAGLYSENPFVEAEEAGRMVSQLCGEDETVHIVGSEPEILWYARRKGTTRFDIAYPMTLPTRFAAGYQREALAALEREPPAVVVVASTHWGFGGPAEVFADYLRRMERLVFGAGYQLAWSFVPGAGGWVPGGEWGERERAGATLGVFRR